MTLNRASRLPFYAQLHDELRAAIRRGTYKPGDLLPTETELMTHFGASRITVRQALDLLVQQGLVYRRRARGTFVAHPTVEQGLVRIVSFTEDMRRRGLRPATRVLSAGRVAATAGLAERLGVEPGTELARLERLRLANGEPMSVEESFLVHSACPGILKKHNYATYPLREALERDYGVLLARARQTIRAQAASQPVARALGVKRGAPVLAIERVSFSQDNLPVEFLRVTYRADRYALYNELQG
jgi:GntR family transcriptional regulator